MDASTDYLRGFNNGYIIRKNHPLLMKDLAQGATGSSDYLKGLKAGGKQYEKEMNVKMDEFNQQRSSVRKKGRVIEL